jgi:hypothetical protein
MNVTEEAARGEECVSCGKAGKLEDNQIVGHTGPAWARVEVWACPGGCVVIAGMSR